MAKNFDFRQSDGPCLALKERTEIVLKLLWKLVDANFFHPLTIALLKFFSSTVHFVIIVKGKQSLLLIDTTSLDITMKKVSASNPIGQTIF